MSFLSIEDVSFRYQGKNAVINQANWEIEKGEFHCLLGKSGCGKTTLLKIASGLLPPNEGRVYLQGKELTEPSHECGFVFQSPALLEWKTVMDNVLLPVVLRRKTTPEDREKAVALLELVGLCDYLNRHPAQLSGGQQSRVALARALIQKPSMMFLDEPFASLDAITREELQEDLLKICQLEGTTVLFITHDISEAVYLADRVAVMEQGEIIYEADVNLLKPRTVEMRYDPNFNELCLKVRQVMGGGV
ncbi:ATP-binding cassette domain-containing protein [Bacillus aerolatus]|uniref:ATP-binding cassette domain-containing protein n=1 Tax=Bacillus aerolatus TaxID=2653354 RepID=A0A6I1FIH0_9BACI|nr:ABC transporter ATP-binding protein [Bacillus aerolatus]KAB7705564.1 ATP-binding cassette domain-containing protein [Bacillus aerolatus]